MVVVFDWSNSRVVVLAWSSNVMSIVPVAGLIVIVVLVVVVVSLKYGWLTSYWINAKVVPHHHKASCWASLSQKPSISS